MIGAIIGDIVGSRFEWNNHRSKDFDLMPHQCFFTDDSIMSLAVCDALMRCRPDFTGLGEQAVRSMQEIGRPYPNSGYGGSFYRWMYSDHPKPYNSFGNGAAMRVSGCGYAARSLEEAKALSKAVTEVTHNHPEGIKGAEATAATVYLARTGKSLLEIQDYITKNYYPIDFTLDSIRSTYQFNETCPRRWRLFLSPPALRTPSGTQSLSAATVIPWRRLPGRLQRPITVYPLPYGNWP